MISWFNFKYPGTPPGNHIINIFSSFQIINLKFKNYFRDNGGRIESLGEETVFQVHVGFSISNNDDRKNTENSLHLNFLLKLYCTKCTCPIYGCVLEIDFKVSRS